MHACCGVFSLVSVMLKNTPSVMTQKSRGYVDYLKTAQKVFEACGMDGDGDLPVNKLMEKFSSYMPPDKSEDLQRLLDPERRNPTVSAHELARALHTYGETHHIRIDADESIQLRNGGAAADSDSGISSDMGCQLVEELQSELQDKKQIERRLRLELESTERAHEDALAAVAAERESLRAHIHVMREENSTLMRLRSDYEETSERLVAAETALESHRRELDSATRKLHHVRQQNDTLETERAALQALLAKSKEECHRINDMYAARQAALLEENENYKTNYADLNIRFQEQEEFLQQTLKEKVLLEMEMADLLNRSTRESRPVERSFEVSCTDQQLLEALDSLNIESDCREEEASHDELYISDSKIERGRPSLFDELLRVDSFYRFIPEHKQIDKEAKKADDEENEKNSKLIDNDNNTKVISMIVISDVEDGDKAKGNDDATDDSNENTEDFNYYDRKEVAVQTDIDCIFNDGISTKTIASDDRDNLECLACKQRTTYINELEMNLIRSEKTMKEMHVDLTQYEQNLTVLQSNFDNVEDKNKRNQGVIELLRKKIECMENNLNTKSNWSKNKRLICIGTQTCDLTATVATQADEMCGRCEQQSQSVGSAPTRGQRIRKFMWETFRGVLQLFAVLCLVGGLLFLYNVSHYSYANRRCIRNNAAVPWQWLTISDIFDMIFRIEYIGEIPM